jgi:fatty-acyl-CoA synthase
LTLVDALDRAATLDRPKCGLVFVDRRENELFLSWPEVRERAWCAAGALAACGVKAGDRVAIILPTCPEFMDVLFGCQVLGAVPVPLYPPLRLGRLDEYHERTLAMLAGVSAVAIVSDGRVGKVLGRTVEKAALPLGMIRAERLADAPRWDGTCPAKSDDLAMVQFSSGTVVAPKPVALTHAQVLANVDVILDIKPPGSPGEDCGVSWLPLYHDMGLIGCVFPAVARPAKLALIPPEAFLARPALWLRVLSKHQGVISPAPNFAYALCLERIVDADMEGVDLSGWLFALNGAEPVSADTLRRFVNRFSKWGLARNALTPVYGLSEAALAVTFGDPLTPFRVLRVHRGELGAGRIIPTDLPEPEGCEMVSVGRPLRGFEVEIRTGEGDVLGACLVGRIHVSGPSLMQGYLDRDESPIRNGWLDTGDLGFMHQGELFVTGRAKDVLVVRGQNHAPQDLELAADRVTGVRTGCVAAVAEVTAEGERILLFVEVREQRSDLEEDVRKAVLASTSVVPDQVVLLDPGTLPRTSSGKIRRGETLRRWQSLALTAPSAMGPVRMAGVLAESIVGHWRDRARR